MKEKPMAVRLDEAGVVVTTIRYNGVIHDFKMLNEMAELPATKSLIRHAAAELKHYLGFAVLFPYVLPATTFCY